MLELKRQKNEAQVEKDLHIQYLERQIMGKQSCEDRLHKKEETALQKEIEKLSAVLSTETEVNKAVEVHLKERVTKLNSQYKSQETKKDDEVALIEAERHEIKNRCRDAKEEMARIVEKIKIDTEDRKKRDQESNAEEMAKGDKVKEKMNMEDAARYIQRRWDWFQKEGKFLAKKKKKGKGKKKKKK